MTSDRYALFSPEPLLFWLGVLGFSCWGVLLRPDEKKGGTTVNDRFHVWYSSHGLNVILAVHRLSLGALTKRGLRRRCCHRGDLGRNSSKLLHYWTGTRNAFEKSTGDQGQNYLAIYNRESPPFHVMTCGFYQQVSCPIWTNKSAPTTRILSGKVQLYFCNFPFHSIKSYSSFCDNSRPSFDDHLNLITWCCWRWLPCKKKKFATVIKRTLSPRGDVIRVWFQPFY